MNTGPVGEDMGLNFETDRDHLLAGQCDQSFLDLTVQLGWEDDLFKYYDFMSEQGQTLIEEYRRKNSLVRSPLSIDESSSKKRCCTPENSSKF